MRDIYLIDPHTWVSMVPDAISEKLRQNESVVRQSLTDIGPIGWKFALTNSSIRLPVCRTRQAFVDFLAEKMDADKILLLAITFTRIQIARHLKHRTECLACSIRGRDSLFQLCDLAMIATETIFSWGWIIPFNADGVFDFDCWESPDIPY